MIVAKRDGHDALVAVVVLAVGEELQEALALDVLVRVVDGLADGVLRPEIQSIDSNLNKWRNA